MANSRLVDLIYQLKGKCAANDIDFIQDLNISQAEYNLFLGICHCGSLNIRDLSDEIGLSSSRLSRIIDKAVKNEYLTRATDSNDRRVLHLELTEKGQKIKSKIENYRQECENRLNRNLSADEVEYIKTNFAKVLSIL
jgi:DNA-binding MarR family transcriptional regulator